MNGLNHTFSGDSRNPAVLFLHGFMGSAEDWRGVISALKDRFFCVAVDLPGHGASLELPDRDYSFEGAARAVIRLLNRLEIEQTAMTGYSMGGRLALYLALRHPQRCAGLFLESVSPGLENEAERKARRASDEKLARRLETEDFEKFLEDWYRQPLFASLSRHEGLVEELVSKRRYNDPNELARSLRGMGTGSQPSLWGELSDLRVPALAVAGELDEKFVGVTRRMASLTAGCGDVDPHNIPCMYERSSKTSDEMVFTHHACGSIALKTAVSFQIRDISVPGAGHNIHAEVPKACLKSLKGFFNEVLDN